MEYRGYHILANVQRIIFFELDSNGVSGEEVKGVQYQVAPEMDELWYSVVDKDNWCVQSFDTIEECKEHIREEL